MPASFRVETRLGFRAVEFDPDVFRFRDVRILVDRARVAEMPYPKPATPYHQASFDLDGHDLVAVAYLLPGPPSPDAPMAIGYDLFAAGRSLTDGSLLADAKLLAASPGRVYPGAFQVVDMVLRILPASLGPAVGIALGRSVDLLGLPTVIVAAVVGLAALVVAARVAGAVWAEIRSFDAQPVPARAALGCLVGVAIYGVVVGALLFVVIVVRGPIGESDF